MLDILALPKRMFHEFGQMSSEAVNKTASVDKPNAAKQHDSLSSVGERINALAEQFNVKSLPVSEIMPLQKALTDTGLVNSTQVRAQGLLTQLAYQHQKTGPMDLEGALEDHLQGLKEKPAVLADYQEGRHVLNLVCNLSSAREQAMPA